MAIDQVPIQGTLPKEYVHYTHIYIYILYSCNIMYIYNMFIRIIHTHYIFILYIYHKAKKYVHRPTTQSTTHQRFFQQVKSNCSDGPFCQNVKTIIYDRATHNEADLELQSCRHHGLDRPRKRLIHLLRSQQMQILWTELAAHSGADLELQSCRHQGLDRPK